MRFVVRVLGAEVLALELDRADQSEAEPEETFGFHGGPGGQVEHAGDAGDQELRRW